MYIRSSYIYKDKVTSLAEVSKSLLGFDQAVACPEGEADLEPLFLHWWTNQTHTNLTHTQVRISCSSKYLKNHHHLVHMCSASPGYRSNTSQIQIYPTNITNDPKFEYCTMGGVFDSNAPFLNQWVYHQQQMGIQHLVIYVNQNFTVNTYIQSLINSGFLELVQWHEHYNRSQIFYKSQHLAYVDYVWRFRGLCEWTFFGDTDDFFVDWNNNHSIAHSIRQQAKLYPDHDEIYFRWVPVVPECDSIDHRKLPINNDFLNDLTRSRNFSNYKHARRTAELVDVGIHHSNEPRLPPWMDSVVWHVRYRRPSQIISQLCTNESYSITEEHKKNPRLFE